MNYQTLVEIENECEKLSYMVDKITAKYYGQMAKLEVLVQFNANLNQALELTIRKLSNGSRFSIIYNVANSGIDLLCDDVDITMLCDKSYEKVGDYFKVILIMIHNGTWKEKIADAKIQQALNEVKKETDGDYELSFESPF